MLRKYLPVIGGIVLIIIGATFLLINRMNQTMYTLFPALAAILIGIGVILWKLPTNET